MKRSGIPRGAWVLLLLLVVATSMILFGSREMQSNPDSASYGASGLRAYRTLLEKNGFKTRQSLSTIRPIGIDELAIAVFLAGGSPNLEQDEWHKSIEVGGVIKKHLERGGRVLMVSIPSNFRDSSKTALSAPTEVVSAIDASKRKLSIGATSEYGDWTNFSYSEKDYVLWNSATGDHFIWMDKLDGGFVTGIANGIGMTNRFIDREENAQTMVEAALVAAGPFRKAVFLEAAHGMHSEVSLVEMIGPWAAGAWWQLTVAFFVLIAALGIRFGHPDRTQFRQRGSREIADAMSDLFARSRATEIGMQSVLEDADRQVRRRLKMAGDTPKDVRDRAIPDELAKAFYHAENAAKERAPISAALPIARALDREVAKFVGVQDRRPAKRNRSAMQDRRRFGSNDRV